MCFEFLKLSKQIKFSTDLIYTVAFVGKCIYSMYLELW